MHHCDGFSDRFWARRIECSLRHEDAVEKMVMNEVDDEWVGLSR